MNNKAENKNPATQRESFTELLGKLANNSAAVFHDEIELVFQRIREKVSVVHSGALTVVTGAFISFAAFLSLCAALVIELTSYMPPVIAALATGAALGLIGFVIVVIGYKKLKKSITRKNSTST
ncbi:MAG: phage holin family protein [Geobacteraceae bacterium]|nr:MAG: phage holin family protein [Geobacteraceae bacterium]